MGREGSGVTESAGKVRLTFQYNSARCRETLDLKWSVSNRRAAEVTLNEIKEKIRKAEFNYAEYFPLSLKVRRGDVPSSAGAKGRTVGEVLDAWLITKSKLAPNTKKLYRNAAEVWKTIFGHETPLSKMTAEHVETTIAQHPFASPKLMNDYLIVMRGAMKLASKGDKKWSDPTVGVENAARQKPRPEPLSKSEMKKVLDYMKVNFDPRVHAYFVFMFETGERPEEAIAHQWQDVDWTRRTINVCRARTLSQEKQTKTYETRDVDLSASALDALRVMKAHPMTARGDADTVFHNPVTLRPWNSSRAQHEAYWLPALAACKVASRRSYNTRHTFATLRLMVGAVPAYIARQMGHESAMMLFKTYSKWIDADKSERNRVEALLAA
ncbi:MAG: tyrosine-type recombinase/integrase [Vitreoscilla sp.]|nr:tyrosine-type recombinase/integrase [Polaromonas sp.]